MKYARNKDEYWCISDKHGETSMSIKYGDEGSQPRPKIDRTQSREVPMGAILEEEHLLWESLGQHKAGVTIMHFEHGDESVFDVIVGADGT